jgi:Zinc carboxypeptidase
MIRRLWLCCSPVLTRAESSRWEETSRHADVLAFLAALEERRDPRFHRGSFGQTPEGRDLPWVVLSAKGVTTPAEARAAGLPVVLVLCGIHAGEVEGKEAALMLMRDLLADQVGGLLDRLTLLVVPLFNADGNDRIDPANRAFDLAKLEGQLGPKTGVGTRVNASGINLNRDYLRQDAPEMRLLSAGVWLPWAPDLTIDCHSTNGSVHRFQLTYDTPHTTESGRPEPIAYMRERFLPDVTDRVRRASGRETFYYGNFIADEGGTDEGWITYAHHPRFGSNYRGLSGRLDLLLETYSYQPFEERVRTTYEFLRHALEKAAEDGSEIKRIVAASRRPRDRIAIRSRLEADGSLARILTRDPRTLDGEPSVATLPHFCRFVPEVVVPRPWAYALPEALGRRVAQHGLRARVLAEPVEARVEVSRIAATTGVDSRRILEASGERLLSAEVSTTTRRLPAGTWIIETEQPLGAIAVYLSEAESDDGLVACGWLPAPSAGEEWPVLRVLERL